MADALDFTSDDRSTDRAPRPFDPLDEGRARTVAEFLLDIGAVQLRPKSPFTWSSGLVAPIYCDNRLTLSYPRRRRVIRDGFSDVLDRCALLPATIAGTATAGIPHAAWLAEAVEQPMAYVRSSAKTHGTGARIEGVVEAGDEVVVVEDLISTGGSALDAVSALREMGATVRAVLAIFSYQLDAATDRFQKVGVECHVLSNFGTLVDVAFGRNELSIDEMDVLKAWRTEPERWSAEHGGEQPE